MKKENFDKQAEREALALKKQGRLRNSNNKRIRQSKEYNKGIFDKLFKG